MEKFLKMVLIVILITTAGFAGYLYNENKNSAKENTVLINGNLNNNTANDEDLITEVVETKINNIGSCRRVGSMNDIYPPGKYQFIKEYAQDTSWKCVGGGYSGDMFTCSGKEVPIARVHAQVGDVVDVCGVINEGSLSEPKWKLDIGRNNSAPAPSIPLSYVKKVPDTTQVSY